MNPSRSNKELKLNKIFTGIDESTVNLIFKNDNFREVSEGEIIYQTGDEAKYLYLVIRGDVKIKFPSHHYISNKIFNEFFGEKELIDNTRRISSAVADSRCLLYLIDKKQFEVLSSKHPKFKQNIFSYGEVELPELQPGATNELTFPQTSKPISFRAIDSKEDNVSVDTSVATIDAEEDESIPDTINKIIAEQNPFGKEETEELTTLEIDENDAKDFIKIELDPDETFEMVETDNELDSAISETTKSLNKKTKQESIAEVHPATKHILAALLSIHSKTELSETVEAVKDSLIQLTNSEAAEIYLIDESVGGMKKIIKTGNGFITDEAKLSEGLTGTCALQKKIINFDKPADDSRFNPAIDQPGSEKQDKIIYFPVINNQNRLVAVLQLARKENDYTAEEIEDLKLISGQIALALERSEKIEEVIKEEKRKSAHDLAKFLNDNITIPIDIINKYSALLNNEEFSQKVKEIITMLQKQANSFLDIIQSAFDYATEDFEIKAERLNLDTFVNGISELLSEYCIMQDVELFKKTGADVEVDIDPGKTFMAVYQLIKIACKNPGDEKRVFIDTERESDYALLTISYEGNAPADETAEGNDEPGLQLAKKLIKLHKGDLTIDSNDESGNVFTISLPIAKVTN